MPSRQMARQKRGRKGGRPIAPGELRAPSKAAGGPRVSKGKLEGKADQEPDRPESTRMRATIKGARARVVRVPRSVANTPISGRCDQEVSTCEGRGSQMADSLLICEARKGPPRSKTRKGRGVGIRPRQDRRGRGQKGQDARTRRLQAALREGRSERRCSAACPGAAFKPARPARGREVKPWAISRSCAPAPKGRRGRRIRGRNGIGQGLVRQSSKVLGDGRKLTKSVIVTGARVLPRDGGATNPERPAARPVVTRTRAEGGRGRPDEEAERENAWRHSTVSRTSGKWPEAPQGGLLFTSAC